MLHKKLMVFVCSVTLLLAPGSVVSEDKDPDLNWKNADFVTFDKSIYVYDDKIEVSPEDRSEMQAWYLALREAAMLLPAGFVKDIASDFDDPDCRWSIFGHDCSRMWIKFEFFINSDSWVTAYPDAVNLRPSATELPYWLTWEPFPKDGYSEEERIWVALHEFAHRYNKGKLLLYNEKLYWRLVDSFKLESPTTFYGCDSEAEDFADTFALYVMFPEQLKKFSIRYGVVKDILGLEYGTNFQMPNSVASKLTDPINGCRNYETEVKRRIINRQ